MPIVSFSVLPLKFKIEMQLPAQPDISNAFKLIDNELAKVKELIDEQLPSPFPSCLLSKTEKGAGKGADKAGISQLLGFFDSCGGKMLRPKLVLLAGKCCGKITKKHILVAAVVEMIHNATLLHDDVIDQGQKRRGAPTVNSLYGSESSVLLGDFLLSCVFKMCADLQPEVIRIIAETTARICEGEISQIIQKRNWQLSEAEYIDIITEKSASVFSSSCLLGGLLAGAAQTQLQALADFGLNVGIAFQIIDDLLDITGTEDQAGKTLGSDVDKNKPTLAVIHLLNAADQKEKTVVIENLNTTWKSRKVLMDMLISYGSLDYAHSRARQFVARAVQALSALEQSDAKEALIETAGLATSGSGSF